MLGNIKNYQTSPSTADVEAHENRVLEIRKAFIYAHGDECAAYLSDAGYRIALGLGSGMCLTAHEAADLVAALKSAVASALTDLPSPVTREDVRLGMLAYRMQLTLWALPPAERRVRIADTPDVAIGARIWRNTLHNIELERLLDARRVRRRAGIAESLARLGLAFEPWVVPAGASGAAQIGKL